MVAFNSTRRQSVATSFAPVRDPEPYPLTPLVQPPEKSETLAGSRRDSSRVVVQRDAVGEVQQVRIGRWRTIAASPQRRIAEVRDLTCGRIAMRFDLRSSLGGAVTSVVWQLFDQRGRMVAAMQLTPDGANALLTSYETRHVCRLVRDGGGELQAVEKWRM